MSPEKRITVVSILRVVHEKPLHAQKGLSRLFVREKGVLFPYDPVCVRINGG